LADAATESSQGKAPAGIDDDPLAGIDVDMLLADEDKTMTTPDDFGGNTFEPNDPASVSAASMESNTGHDD